jgi:hypothetical protein
VLLVEVAHFDHQELHHVRGRFDLQSLARFCQQHPPGHLQRGLDLCGTSAPEAANTLEFIQVSLLEPLPATKGGNELLGERDGIGSARAAVQHYRQQFTIRQRRGAALDQALDWALLDGPLAQRALREAERGLRGLW